MSLVDFTTDGPVSVYPSEVESERFGYVVGRCPIPIPSTAAPSDIARLIEGHDADITVLRYAAENMTWFGQLGQLLEGYRLLHADDLIYWELTVGHGHPPQPEPDIQIVSDPDRETVGDLTAAVFAGYTGHYRANPLLSAAGAEAGYVDWALRTPPHNTLVMEKNKEPVGIATTAPSAEHIEILLAGVVPTARGRGNYSHLLRGVEMRAQETSLERVVISTQSHNIGVQRAWARYGFLPLVALSTVHVVRADLWESHHS